MGNVKQLVRTLTAKQLLHVYVDGYLYSSMLPVHVGDALSRTPVLVHLTVDTDSSWFASQTTGHSVFSLITWTSEHLPPNIPFEIGGRLQVAEESGLTLLEITWKHELMLYS